MPKQVSYSKIEKEVRPMLRENLSLAESTEDVKKFFIYAVMELLEKVLEGQVSFGYEDIALAPDEKNGFTLSASLMGEKRFQKIWKESDLPHILKRMAEVSLKRHIHLEKNLNKTEAKMYPIPG